MLNAYLIGELIGTVGTLSLHIAAWWKLGRWLRLDTNPEGWLRWRWLVLAYVWVLILVREIGYADLDHPVIYLIMLTWLPLLVGGWILGAMEIRSWIKRRPRRTAESTQDVEQQHMNHEEGGRPRT